MRLRHISSSRWLRIAVVLLAIVALLGVSAASESAKHFHTKSAASGCDLCVTAHVAAEQARSAVHLLNLPDVYARFLPGTVVAGYQFLIGKAALTRGPPSLTL